MSFSLTRDTAIRFLVESNILEEIDGAHEHKAGVIRIVRSGTQHGNAAIKLCCLRISATTLRRLYNDRKSLINRDYISALYSIGLGVPRDLECARFWHKMSISNCKCDVYKSFSALLKKQLKETITDSYYVYSNDVIKQNRLLDNVKSKNKCAIVYKSVASGYQLHNIIVDGKILVYSLRPARLGIPTSVSVNVKNALKYVVRLGTLEQAGNYDLDLSMSEALAELASVDPDADLINDFSKQVYFDHKASLAVDFNWKINAFKRKI